MMAARPWEARQLPMKQVIAVAAIPAAGIYCKAHGLLTGTDTVALSEALGRASLTMLPWVAAFLIFEHSFAKRLDVVRSATAAAVLALCALILAGGGAALLEASFLETTYRMLPSLPVAAALGALRAAPPPAAEQKSYAGGEALPCAVCDIMLVASAGNYVEIRLPHRTILWRQTMQQAEAILGDGFVRVHRRYIVPRYRIEAVHPAELALDDGELIPVSRPYRHMVRPAGR